MPFRFERWHLWFRQVFFARLLGLLGPVLYWAAYAWRRLLRGTTFIAITGSLGKTTSKDCLAAILGDHYSTFRTVGTQNARRLLSLNLLRVRPWHRFAVLEVATREPGTLAPASSQVRPDVAIVLGVAPTHIRSYASLDEIAHEKMQILQGLKPGGLVILNGDDARLNAFPVDPRFRVEKFGTGSGLQLRASSISSRWPDRLSFLAVDGDTSAEVRTRMVGTHWVPSILAAMLAARHCGIDLRRSAEVLQNVPPSRGKMEPVLLPGGAVVIRDEYNASPRSYDAALKVLEQARAGRRIAVFGDMSDSKDNTKSRLRRLGQRAAEVCEFALFVGESGHHSRYGALQGGLPESSVFCCTLPEEAASFLAGELRPGDVVLVKGWTSQHLERLTFAQVGAVACWTAHCRKTIQCDTCWKLGVSSAERAKLKPAQTLLSSPAGTGRSSGPPGFPEPSDRKRELHRAQRGLSWMNESVFRRYGVVPPRIDDFDWVTTRLRVVSRLLTFILVQMKSSFSISPGITFRLRHAGFTTRDLLVYRLNEHPSHEYLSTFEQWVGATRINGSFDHIVNNKLVFPLLMKAAGIPCPRYFGSLGRTGFRPADGRIESDLVRGVRGVLKHARRIVIKPAKGWKGVGLLFLSCDAGSLSVNGVTIPDDDLNLLLRRLGTAIVTEFIEQGEYARNLFPSTTNTIRFLTVWDYSAGIPFIAAVAQRIGNSRSYPADNFRGGDGGLSAEVDMATGVLSRAATLDEHQRLRWFDSHPESGAPIVGTQVPHWPDTVRSILEGARALAFAPCLAWDVVITDEAFTVVEINGGPGLHVHQIHRPILTDPRVRDFYRFHGVIRR